MSQKLAEVLLRDRIITEAHYAQAQQAAQEGSTDHVRFLIEKGFVDETKLLYYLGQKFGLPSINLAKFNVPPEVIALVPMGIVAKAGAIPIQSSKGTLVLAVCDPTNLSALEDVKFQTKMNVEAVLTTFSAFEQAAQKYYGGSAFAGAAIESFQKESRKRQREQKSSGSGLGLEQVQIHNIDTSASEDDAPVISLVNGILGECIKRMASDIHVEPYEKKFRVRLRVDGTLLPLMDIPIEMKRAVTARFKIMSRMDIAETRVPQDGRIKLTVRGREVDFRVNSLPTLFGEKVVLRMLNKGNLQLDLQKLGFEPGQLQTFLKGIMQPNGMVLVTGPTGSGKTTTLYSALAELNKISDNLSTAEDPVEYNLEGINQVQINKDVGLTFASVLRALLRQDPDTILVGEIRDYETAEVASQAAMTGHLVLSTLHTNDAPSTVTRLMNMGLEPFLVTSAVNSILAQRLVRKVCPHCKVKDPTATPEKLQQFGFTAEQAGRIQMVVGQGCDKCNKTGYLGRVAIYEVMDFTGELKEMVLKGATSAELRKVAVQQGMKSLRMSALTKAAEGLTSLDEAVSSTME